MPNIATGPAQLALEAYTGLFNNAVLGIYAGTQPGNAEALLGSNILLCSFQFDVPPFATVTSSGGYSYQIARFVAQSVAPAATGIANFGRITFATAASHSGAWTASTPYVKGDIVSSNGSFWVAVNAGTSGATAPIGSNVLGFSDGVVVWNWINPVSQGQNLGDFSVGLSASSDIQLGNTTISTGTNVVCTSFRFQTPSS